MTKKLLSFCSILALCLTAPAMSATQEVRSGVDLRDVDPGLAKQIARDKQLLEIWKDHVRALTHERDEAYQRIEELKSGQGEIPAVPVQESMALETSLQGANQQFAVEMRPEMPAQNPASQKFYADLTKNYMLQQGSIKKLKTELARLETEKTAASQEELLKASAENEILQKSYDEAISRVRVLESEAQGLESQVARLGSENQEIRKSYNEEAFETEGLKSRVQNSETELQKTNANNRSLQELIEKIKAEAQTSREQKAAADQTIQNLNARFQDQAARSKELESGLQGALTQVQEEAKRSEEAREDFAAQNETLREKLNSNAADIQNLKENFETMLEPLLSSFEDRKKVV